MKMSLEETTQKPSPSVLNPGEDNSDPTYIFNLCITNDLRQKFNIFGHTIYGDYSLNFKRAKFKQ